jgi:hypothetical protein
MPHTDNSGVHFPVVTVNCEGEHGGRATCAEAKVAPDDNVNIDIIAKTAVSVDAYRFIGTLLVH